MKKLDKNASKRDAEAIINNKDSHSICWLWALAHPVQSAAVYSARKGIRTGVVADRFGGQVMDTMAIENFISVKEPRKVPSWLLILSNMFVNMMSIS